MIKLIALFLLPAALFSSQLNNLETGDFVDIGKTTGFTEVETPKTVTLEKPTYSIVDNIVNSTNRVLDIDGCFVDGSNIESCLKNENICKPIYTHGEDKITKHSNSVVDYTNLVSSSQNYRFSINLGKTEHKWNYIWHSSKTFNISDVRNIASATVKGGADDAIEIIVNGHVVYAQDRSPKNCQIAFYKGISQGIYRLIYCGKNQTIRILSETKKYTSFGDKDFKRYLKNGKNTVVTYVEVSGGGNGNSTYNITASKADTIIGVPNTYLCPTGYTLKKDSSGKATKRCVKNLSYDYYTYGCKDSRFTPINKGLSSCGKIDTDKNSINETELSRDCNAALPPKNNCREILYRCPVSNTAQCAYKGNKIDVFLPLKHFDFESPSFFKEWEYGNIKGYKCSTYEKQTLFDSHDQNLVASYELDEEEWGGVEGEVRDGTGTHDGTAMNGAETVASINPFGEPARMATFKESIYSDKHEYISIENFPKIARSRTITAWIKADPGLVSHGRIFADDSHNLKGDYVVSYGDKGDGIVRFYIRGLSPVSLDTNKVIQENKWYFIAATFDADKMKKTLYVFNVDGELVDEVSASVSGTLNASEGIATIGGEDELGTEGSASGFHGNISSVHISNQSFSLAEIKNAINLAKNKQLLASYDCQFGIKEINAEKPGEICFKDMHNYETCISYKDYSSCNIHGVIRSGNSFPIKGLRISDDRKTLSPTNMFGANGRIHTDCMFHGKVGYDDVGLGIISVKGDKNRLYFWNSYKGGMVGFLDVIPKKNNSINEASALTKFSFENLLNGFFDDESLNGISKDFIPNVVADNVSVEGGVEGNALRLDKDRNDTIAIKGGNDLDFKGLSELSVSMYVKLLSFPKSDSYILYNKNQIAIKISKGLKISATVRLSDGSVKNLTSNSPLKLNRWTLITFSISPKTIELFVDSDKPIVTNSSLSIGGDNEREIILGENRDATGKLDMLIDNILISNSAKSYAMQKILLETNPDLYSYLHGLNNEVEDLMANKGFDVLYKSDNGHTYMVSKDKISAAACYSKINGTTFSLAVADANLSNFPKKNLVKINQVINSDCEDSELSACDEDISSKKCIAAGFADGKDEDASYLSGLVSQIHSACKEKMLIRGLSKESMNYGYGYKNNATAQHCIIESSDTKHVSFHGIEFIRRSIDNDKNVDEYVCSNLSCNKNHYCGVATCKKDTSGTIGVPTGYIGCVDQSCDISKKYYEKCGDMSGCLQNRDIISSIIESVSANKKIKVETMGYDIVSQRYKHSVYVDDTKVMNLLCSWNVITFDDNYNILEKKSFDIHGDQTKADRLEAYLKSIAKGTMTIIATYDEPARNVVDNVSLLDAMENFGMNRYTLEHLETRSAYLFVGKKGDAPRIEEYVPPFEDGLEKTFSFIKSSKQTKCYKVTCPDGSNLNKETMQCEKTGCDDSSILKDGKCISKIAN